MMIHADTSVLISRIFDLRERRAAAGQALAGVTVCICGYVVQELRATYVRDAALLHKLIFESGLAEAQRRFKNYRKAPRRPEHMQQILAHITEHGSPDSRNVPEEELALEYLEMFLEGYMMQLFTDGLQCVEHDNVGCCRGDAVGQRDGDLYSASYKCTHPNCGLKDFLVAKAAGLRSIVNGPDELDGVHERLRSTADAAISDPASIKSANCYGVLADVIIALECPDEATLCTTNMKHSEPICEALGLDPPLDANPPPSS